MISIYRVILANPAILIQDVATRSVDPRTGARIQKAFFRVAGEGWISIVIARRLSTIRDDKVVVIDGRRIVEQGSHDELLAARDFYHRRYMSQF
jgi:ATP-binding cassette, subfamily B, multidrug efflux pump